jgi:hypothetical protein
MGMRIGIETDVARVAGNLVAAWESGDRHVLEVAVREAVNELGEAPARSALAGEFRELLLGVAETLDDLLSTGQAAAYRHGSQWGACYDLLRHAQGAASASFLRPQG